MENNRLFCSVSYTLDSHGTQTFFGCTYMLSVSHSSESVLIWNGRGAISPIQCAEGLMKSLESAMTDTAITALYAPVSFEIEFRDNPDEGVRVSHTPLDNLTYVPRRDYQTSS